jgi:energy-coupling factor transporter ATP-binding protein EcfA2
MTGRENVFLNGVILGMGRKEVARRFDSIVDFSGVGRFIDTPVKRYSSGMYVRLAFAVAAHVDPAVLLVDEVLAVGDVAFRAKCYRRMAELRRNGTTIVLVSHSIYAIRDTCDRALLLWHGQLLEDGQPDSVISSYLARMQADGIESGLYLLGNLERSAHAEAIESTGTTAKIVEVVFRGNSGQPVKAVESGSPVTIEVRYSSLSSVGRPIFRIDFYREGNLYTGFSTAYDDEPLAPLMGDGEVSLQIRNTYLPPGVYSISVVIAEAYEFNLLDTHHQAYFLQILRSPNSRGDVPLPHTWQHRFLDTSEEERI